MEPSFLDTEKESQVILKKLCQAVHLGILILNTNDLEDSSPIFMNEACKEIVDTIKDSKDIGLTLTDSFRKKLLPLILSSLTRSYHQKTNIVQALHINPDRGGPKYLAHIIYLEPTERFPSWCLVLFESVAIEEFSATHNTLMRCVGSLTHDFNNLLMIIHSYTELLKFRLDKDQEGYTYLSPIQNAAFKAGTLVQQMMEVCNESFNTSKVFNLKDTVLDIKHILEYTLSEHAHIHIQAELEDAFIEANPCEIEQILTNLCLNAKEAMPRGGMLIMRLESDPTSPHVCLSVEDQGQGIPEGIRNQLFKPSFTTKAHKLGHGFGLCNTASIIKKLQGFIEVESIVGKGSTFKLFFKKAHKGPDLLLASQLASHANIKAVAPPQALILLEPDEDTYETLRVLLSTKDYTILEVPLLDALANIPIHRPYTSLAALLLGPGLGMHTPSAHLLKLMEKVLEQHPHVKIISLSSDHELEKYLKDRYRPYLFCFPNLQAKAQILKVLPAILSLDKEFIS